MTRETTPPSQAPSASRVPITIWPGGYEALKLYERELATYLRELPRLLEEGHAGRHTLVKGDDILGTWDTQSETIEAGRDRFGLEPIFVKTIDPRDPERFAFLDQYLKDHPCPS